MALPAIVHLKCSCCGASAGFHEQHWNRDAGYGICRKCIDSPLIRRSSAEEILDLYGEEGVNYELPADKPKRFVYAGVIYTTTAGAWELWRTDQILDQAFIDGCTDHRPHTGEHRLLRLDNFNGVLWVDGVT